VEAAIAPLKPLAVSVSSAASLTGLSRSKVYALISDGRLDAIRVDGRRLVRFASIERLLAVPERHRQEAED
jgi:excisionase family DNA binding protein